MELGWICPYTLLQKKRNFTEPIFPGDVGSLQSSSIYTHPKKKRNFPCCVSFEDECKCWGKNTKIPWLVHIGYREVTDGLHIFTLNTTYPYKDKKKEKQYKFIKVMMQQIDTWRYFCQIPLIMNLPSPMTVLESPGKPVTGSPSILKGCHNSLIEGSPSIEGPTCYKSSKNAKDIDGAPVTGIPGVSRTVWGDLFVIIYLQQNNTNSRLPLCHNIFAAK